jgi:ribonuclease Z
MGNFVYGVENVFISHQHGDHILGLPSLVGIRNSARGDKEKPLNVFYPKDNSSVRDLEDFIWKRNRHLSYELNFVPIEQGFKFIIDNTRYIEAFNMSHQKNATTLGYAIREHRSRLKAEFVGKNIPELLKAGVIKTALNENYTANVFAYCLDSCGFDYSNIANADLAIMDCTFINKNDRDDLTHFTLDEAKSICHDAGVKKMVAAHFSPRYHNIDITGVDYWVNPNRVLEI